MSATRRCTKTACQRAAVATLTYAYAERAVVVGPLATYAEPHTYDLCSEHALRMTAPVGWDVVRIAGDGYAPVGEDDDLLALVDAVRERPPVHREPVAGAAFGQAASGAPLLAAASGMRRGHLRVLPGSAPE